jgi:hypothetical protein
MTVDNIEEIKAALAALKERQAPTRRSRIRAVHHPAPVPDPRTTQAAAAAATAGINARRRALSMLGQPNDLYTYYVTLDAFLSNELPSTELGLVQENGTSFMKIYLDSHHNDCPPGGADSQFYFAWKNPSDDYVNANVWSALSLNGQAYASASEGNFADLFLTPYLDIWRFTGWGIDPDTGQSADGTPYPTYPAIVPSIPSLNTYRPPPQGAPGLHPSDTVSYYADMPYVLTTGAPVILIPGGAVTIFEVGLTVYWQFKKGEPPDQTTEDQPQEVKLDLANDKLGFMIQCPTVELGILAPRTLHGPPFDQA